MEPIMELGYHSGPILDRVLPLVFPFDNLSVIKWKFKKGNIICNHLTRVTLRFLRLPSVCVFHNSNLPSKNDRPICMVIFQNSYLGKYFPLYEMTEAAQDQLIADHFLFDKPVSPLLTCAGMARDWPDGRGIWHNDEKNFLVSNHYDVVMTYLWLGRCSRKVNPLYCHEMLACALKWNLKRGYKDDLLTWMKKNQFLYLLYMIITFS